MIFEVLLHLLQRALALIFRNDFPSFLEIIFFELIMELIKHCSTTQLLNEIVPETSAAANETTLDEHVPIVNSFTVWKICEGLDLKAKFVPLAGLAAMPRIPHRGLDQTTTDPVVGSFSVWKICQALDLPVVYDPRIVRTTNFRRPNKPIPVVKSTAVFELCKTLDIKV
ncbi:hypothetical protein TNIN_93271 [Trichonephila inaurata madagascariensis]|uniref:Uncharacterized protein n=1 Tax=Trichonephila inaurata madagascariensis TaxID=2747483 RepID=A0A8X6MCN4_9ARAC|nr:hypothetical protein TNIN_93271 [Trichonephila inaurata madagascariensis]